MPEAQIPTRGSRALGRILGENGPLAKRIRARISKDILWRLATGRRRPNEETGPLIEHITAGKIRCRDWIPRDRWISLVKD
jgi:hypothetical protein